MRKGEPVRVGEVFSREVHFDQAQISAFAQSCGDDNPLHHDADYAAGTRFGKIIACGPHVTALLMAMVATHFSKTTPMVGLDFSFRLRAPVFVGDTVVMQWQVTEVTYKPSLRGDIITLAGSVFRPDRSLAVSATGHALLVDAL